MSKIDISEIKKKLKDKQIFLMPYCHADHAWCHFREWHEKRYLVVFDKMIELLKKEPDFKYFIDSWSELLKACLEARPESVDFIREMLKQGRLALIGGHWSNIRFAHIGDEASIRNMVYGKRTVKELFPEASLDVYATLDVGIGHSQVPQLVKLAGYKGCFAWRPQKGLDEQGVPRSFLWNGLSGDEVLVARHSYQGWAHGIEFHEKGDEDPSNNKRDFDYTVKYAWDHYLEKPCSQPDLKTLSFCQGSDDALPFTDQIYGFEIDIMSLINEWNTKGLSSLSLGTPNDLFNALEAQKDKLPTWQGLLDPAELCYHIANNGRNGVWWLRELADRELVLAEQLATQASLKEMSYPKEKLDACWQNCLTFCTHAVENLFKEDFENAVHTLKTVIRDAKEIQKLFLSYMIDESNADDPDSYVVYNPLPEKREEFVSFNVINVDNSRRSPILKDKDGNLLSSQIIEAGGMARDFDVLVKTECSPCSTTQINIEWSKEDAPVPDPEKLKDLDNMTREFASDTVKLVFKEGKLLAIENLVIGKTLTAPEGTELLEPVSLPQEMDYWMPKTMADNPLPFVPESIYIQETGPLRFKISRTGKSGPQFFTQHFTIYSGKDTVDVQTVIDVVPDSTNIALAMPLENDAQLTTDVPFGVEERDISNIKYGHLGEGNYENIERRIPGILWSKSWMFAKSAEQSFGLISVDGPRYYRRHGTPSRLLHFLVNVKPDQKYGWFPKQSVGLELGRNIFNHKLVISGNSWESADMVKQSQQAKNEMQIVSGRVVSSDKLIIDSDNVRLSAFYREGENVILRIVNMSKNNTDTNITLPFVPDNVEVCNFLAEAIDGEISFENNKVNIELSPWQIMTLKILPEVSK